MNIEIITLFLKTVSFHITNYQYITLQLRKTVFINFVCSYFPIEKRLNLLKCQGIQFNYVKHNIKRKKNNLRTSVATCKPVFHLDLQ